MHLFDADGVTATVLTRTSLAGLALRERAHLQKWVIANPAVLGDDQLVVMPCKGGADPAAPAALVAG